MEYDGNLQSNISSATDEVEFNLVGGLYGISAVATWGGGSATLKRLGADGTTWLTAATAITADAANATAYLPKGKYRWTVATATAVYLGLDRIPLG